MEMKIAVARDMQMVMELLASETEPALQNVWQEHAQFVDDFDTFAAAVLAGAYTEEGLIYPAKDKKLRQIVKQAKIVHQKEFQPRFKKIFDLMLLKVSGKNFSGEMLVQLDHAADAIGEKMLETIGSIEDMARAEIKAAEALTSDTTGLQIKLLIIIGLAGVVLSVLLALFITKMITTPIFQANDFAKTIAQGDLTRQIQNDRKDEVGMLIRSLNHMCQNLRKMFTSIASNAQTLNTSSTELSAISEQISDNSVKTAEKSNSVAAAAEEMATNMNSVAAATEQTTANIQTIISASEEMTATINEIATNTAKGSETTSKAVEMARQVSAKVDELGKASAQISKVTETIADISEQTNLLALNATIEAARAGEAGKGFAVVAGEIKTLAKQTADATSEISKNIFDVQNTTAESVTAIESIVSVINEINDIVTTVATAIEEQSATTQEISDNVSHIGNGIEEVNNNISQTSAVVGEVTQDITQVSEASEEVKTGSEKVNLRATELSRLAGELNELVQQFKV